MLTETLTSKFAEYKALSANKTLARTRIEKLFDDGEYTEIGMSAKTGENLSAVITAYGYVDGTPVYAFSQDISTNNGAVNFSQAEKICKIMSLASQNGVPVVGIYDSNGADISNSASSLKAYGDILALTNNLSGVVPQVSVILGSCIGSSAVIATSADFVIATEKAEIYLAANETACGKDAAKNGTVSITAKTDDDAINSARDIISMMPANNISEIPQFEFSATNAVADGNAEAIVSAIADAETVIELSADFGKSAYTALARIGGAAVGVVATNKTSDKLTSADCEKIVRFVRICDAYSVPVVTIIDTEGFCPCANIRKISKVAGVYAEATTLKISVVTGKAYGSAGVAFAASNADVTFAYPDAVISALAPTTAVEFFYHDELKGSENTAADRNALAVKFQENEASAFAAAENGFVDEIISSNEARAKIISVLDVMSDKRLTKKLPKKHTI